MRWLTAFRTASSACSKPAKMVAMTCSDSLPSHVACGRVDKHSVAQMRVFGGIWSGIGADGTEAIRDVVEIERDTFDVEPLRGSEARREPSKHRRIAVCVCWSCAWDRRLRHMAYMTAFPISSPP